jgi:hypothetical protein
LDRPYYTSEIEVTRALANGTFSQHHTNCMHAYEEALAWQRYLKDLAAKKFFFRRKARTVYGPPKNFVFQFTTK